MSIVVEATRENFDELIAEPGLTLVDVWGPQCTPCIALMPHVHELPNRLPGLRVIKLEASKARRVCINYQVMGLPTFLLFKDGQEVSRLSDPQLSAEQLDEWLKDKMEELQGGNTTS